MSAPHGAVVAAIRSAAPRALTALARRTGDFDAAEDALQEALVTASTRWPAEGLPADPAAWLLAVAHRRWIDALRSDVARRRREDQAADEPPPGPVDARADDPLTLMVLCCHPALTLPSRVALTLRAVGGLTTREIARGLLLPEPTVAQRISRAKARLRALGSPFAPAPADELPARVSTTLTVIGLMHTEAHSVTEGDELSRPELAADALRLARSVVAVSPADAPWLGEAIGLTALILLTDARSPARRAPDGAPVSLAMQDRTRWRHHEITEGTALLRRALTEHPIGPFQLRAAIAAVHDEAPSADATDHRQLLGLYDLLRVLDPSPIVELARLVPLAHVRGAGTALTALDSLVSAPPSRVAAVRAHLFDLDGRPADARDARATAAALTCNAAERRWLES